MFKLLFTSLVKLAKTVIRKVKVVCGMEVKAEEISVADTKPESKGNKIMSMVISAIYGYAQVIGIRTAFVFITNGYPVLAMWSIVYIIAAEFFSVAIQNIYNV